MRHCYGARLCRMRELGVTAASSLQLPAIRLLDWLATLHRVYYTHRADRLLIRYSPDFRLKGVYPSISVMRVDALTPRTREISMNSRTLSCRSPASSFHTNGFDRFSFAANSRCVRPAACRASTMTAMSARCLALRRCFNVLFPQEMHHS